MRFTSPLAGLAVALVAVSTANCASQPLCAEISPGGSWNITSQCVDPMYQYPVVDRFEYYNEPKTHHRVSGYFNGTSVNFTVYLPPADEWENRFFQHMYPNQNATADNYVVEFGLDSGAYTVQVSGTLGYRADAAAAKFSRSVARKYYNLTLSDPIYGYVYGGSGGSFQVVGAMENTYDVWQGSVILVQATPKSNPDSWAIRALSGFTLAAKQDEIVGAIRPGGSEAPLDLLDEAERAAMTECLALGIPLAAWEDFDGAFGSTLWNLMGTLVLDQIRAADPTYARDFWNTPGYLGTEDSPLGDFYRASLVDFKTAVREVYTYDNGSIALTLEDMPGNISTICLDVKTATTQTVSSAVNVADRTVLLPASPSQGNFKAGDEVQVNNRWFLATHTYHRHQVPPTSEGYHAWDYLRDSTGKPRYPQRSKIISYGPAKSTSGGSNFTGSIHAKTIVMDSTADYDSFPWLADWYRARVQASLGDEFSDNFRIYYTENADHGIWESYEQGPLSSRIVSSIGAYHQHLRDLSQWVEDGTTPPEQTRYTVRNGQVTLAPTAAERRGIQPVVALSVDKQVKPGEKARLHLAVEVPPNMGQVVAVECDFLGVGEWVPVHFGEAQPHVEMHIEHAYPDTGTYIAGVRVFSQRDGKAASPTTRVANLGHACVIVA